jgi:hypothetical protein
MVTDSRGAVPAVHEEQALCQYLLNSITTTTTLRVLPSEIHRQGTGLFAKYAIPEGADVFRSHSLINCVSNEHTNIVCDYCLANSKSTTTMFRSTGNIPGIGESMPVISQCVGCKVCGYCSKLRNQL